MTDSLLRRAQHTLVPAQQRDLDAIREMCLEDPVMNVVPLMQVEAAIEAGVTPLGLWGVRKRSTRGRDLAGALWAGANLCPVLPLALDSEADDLRAGVASAMIARLTRPAALVGEAQTTLDLWGRVEPWWGPAREVRPRQIAMRIDGPARYAPARDLSDLELEAVRTARPEDYDALLPACVHMFIGEVGYDPMRHGRAGYEARLHQLVRMGRSFIQYGVAEGRRQIVFKAEVGALGGSVAQLQGVWVHPALRGRGLARRGLAAVIEGVQDSIAPTVSLYVNDFNEPALAAYDAVGFTRVGTFATVMF